jgi:DNA repair protein RadA/Sms
MGRGKVFSCRACGHRLSQWAGRCPSCDAWGSIQEASEGTRSSGADVVDLGQAVPDEGRVVTGFEGVDRVLGGGVVSGSVGLLAGEPGIGKSTLLLQLVANLCSAGHPCLLVSGEESHAQVAARARRLGIRGDAVRFAPGRDLRAVIDTARGERPFLLAVDSIQTIRDQDATQMAGGPSQVRSCADVLVGMAKAEGIAVLLTGHVTKDGDLAGPRTLEHAVDVVMAFEGDPRSGLRVLSGGKNRFGAEGESAWFEMGARGLREIDPTGLLVSGGAHPGAATALVRSGRRALAVEVQALVGSPEGPARRHAAGLDPRRFSLVAAVLDRAAGLGLGRVELFGAAAGGIRVEDPACDLAIAAAVVSAAMGVAPPSGSAFVGEVALTGQVRPASSMGPRLSAARAAGCDTVFAPHPGERAPEGMRIIPIRHVADALRWAVEGVENRGRDRTSPPAVKAS